MSSVPASKRTKSHYEPVDNAAQIFKKTIDICLRVPKRYTIILLQYIARDAHSMASCAVRANSIHPACLSEYHTRRALWQEGLSWLNALDQDFSLFLYDPKCLTYFENSETPTKGVSHTDLNVLASLIHKQYALFTSAMVSDEERFSLLGD